MNETENKTACDAGGGISDKSASKTPVLSNGSRTRKREKYFPCVVKGKTVTYFPILKKKNPSLHSQ